MKKLLSLIFGVLFLFASLPALAGDCQKANKDKNFSLLRPPAKWAYRGSKAAARGVYVGAKASGKAVFVASKVTVVSIGKVLF